jgi:SWI/SNF-related matrix-associated actin-dependent regulator 1 of chromatin subfamily A
VKKTLKPFQVVGRDFLASRFHAANGDQPGLGKTLQAIHAADAVNATSALVTCPASVRTNWFEHIEEHFGHTRGWDVISYNAAGDEKHRAALRSHYDVWIGDEIHFCKTTDSKRTQAVFGRGGIIRRADFKWPLSGTLAPNGRPVELFPMLKTLAPAFRDVTFEDYTRRFCGAYFDGRGWNYKGATRIDELNALLRDFMIRRTKREVFPDRKAPLVSKIAVELSALDLVRVIAEEDAIGGRQARVSSRYEDFSQLGDSSKLLRLLGEALVPHVCRFTEDLLSTVDKVVVFAQHVDVMRAMEAHFSKRGYAPVVYRGGMSDTEKDAAKARFTRTDACRVFIGQRQAAGTGINDLQKVCSTVVIAEPPWVPGETEQLIDRLDRMGLEDDLVNAYIMYAKGTLSAVVVNVHDRKAVVGDRLMGDFLDQL